MSFTVRPMLTAIGRKKIWITLVVITYVFCVFILPDLLFARSHVLYQDDINSNFNQRIQRFINEQILVSCMPAKKELVLLEEHLTNEGHNFIYTTRFAPKGQQQQVGVIQVMELGTGGIEVQKVLCPGQRNNLRAITSETPAPAPGVPPPKPADSE